MTPSAVLARSPRTCEFDAGWLATPVGRQVAPILTDTQTPKEKAA